MTIKIIQDATGTAVIGTTAEIISLMFGPPQHDSHVDYWRSMVRAYGDMDGWQRAKDRRAASRERLMQTAEGRDFLARVAAMNQGWGR